jgi:DNA mismatch repair protein MutS
MPTPLMRQIAAIKALYPDKLVLYRMGDFFELFNDDARRAAKLLGLTLTQRKPTTGDPIPMTGVPAWSIHRTLDELSRLGESAVVCSERAEHLEPFAANERHLITY